MRRITTFSLLLFALLAATSVATAGQSIEVRLDDGSRWRGEVSDEVHVTYLRQYIEVELQGEIIKAGDLYITVRDDVGGEVGDHTIFLADIKKMETIDLDTVESAAKPKRSRGATSRRATDEPEDEVPLDEQGRPIGVFVLPLDGGVGETFRTKEIEMMGEHADTFGPGQIIVLLINSNGGSSLESQYIANEIFEIRKRHRVVAWIQKAISAGCQTAMACQEIYFMTEGSAGAVTTWNPGSGQSIKGQDLAEAIDHLVDIAERSGISEHIARSMKTNTAMCSYDKDPETGEVTFYGDLSGEFVLSDGNSNLSFTSSSALHSGFSKGTADTTEDLARLLDLPRWYEIDDYGRRIAKKWQDTFNDAQVEIPRLLARRGYKNSSADAAGRIGTLIQINNKLIRWTRIAPDVAARFGLQEEQLKRQNSEYRKQLADMNRR